MIKASHLREFVIRPALKKINLWSADAEELLMGTAAQESKGGLYLIQETNKGFYINGGLGIFQMEKATHDSHWANSMTPRIKSDVTMACNFRAPGSSEDLITNLTYAAMMCRVHYWVVPEALPPADDVGAMALYWKKHYNTEAGSGTVSQFIKSYHDYVGAK